jgi:hypothetical protein
MNKKYWYFLTVYECVLCDAQIRYKERRYTEKPKNPIERIEFKQMTCSNHF